MGEFIKGMNTIGQLLPAPSPYSNYPPPYSEWGSVANSFKQTGDDIRHAIKENNNAKPESKQTP